MEPTAEVEREGDGRRLVDIAGLPAAMAHEHTREEAAARVRALALRVVRDRLEHGEAWER